LQPKERFRAAKLIYTTFLAEDAPRAVNLAYEVTLPIHQWHQSIATGAASASDIPSAFFDDALVGILDTMSADSFPRYALALVINLLGPNPSI